MKLEDYVLVPKSLIAELETSVMYNQKWGEAYFRFKKEMAEIQKQSKNPLSLAEKSFDAGRIFQRSVMESNLFDCQAVSKEEFLKSDFI